MTPLKNLATYYVHLLSRLGIVKFSISLASAVILVALAIQMSVTFALTGQVSAVDLIRSVFFGLIITPWAVFFMSVVVEQIEDSRQRLSKMIRKLEKMRARDLQLTNKLKANISQLNNEIDEREKAEAARGQAIRNLEQEVKQRQQAQQELEEHSALLRSFIDSSPDLVYYRNEQGQFSGCNLALEQLVGRSEKKLIGLTPYDVYPEDIADKIVETDHQVFDNDEQLTYEQWLEYPDGRKAFFELRKVPFYGRNGNRLGLLGFGRDITERMAHQANIEKANRDKTQFISTLSHELRTPLNGVVGLSQMLLDTPLDDAQRKHVNTILLSATTLGNIFNDIIDLDKLDRRRFAVSLEPMDFKALVTDIETLTEMQLQSKGLDFVFEQIGPIPSSIVGDPTRLRQVLWNLTHNAVKFTEKGEVELTVKAQAVDEQQVQLDISIRDTGPGIPEDQLEQIFAMYYQVEGSKSATGTGIGLSVSRQLVRAMGGDISVTSYEGEGSCFTVSLVVKLDAIPDEAEQIDHPPLEILLVEDVELNVTIAKALLEKLGHYVVVAMTGKEALAAFEPDMFDLVLLDIQLPDMTGFDIAKQWQQQYQAADLPPLVALTANVVNSKNEFAKAGMVDVIHKPINQNAVVHCFNQVFAIGEEAAVEEVISPKQALSRSSLPILDLDLVEQFCDTIGVKVLNDSINLFKQVMPDYMKILESNLFAKDQDGIASEAHKIKGAAGSIGLARIQRLANKIQSPELPAWWDNVEDWILQLSHDYPEDLKLLDKAIGDYSTSDD
ncbi:MULTISPECIES: aerobic respiration two-component sensor histidine kinase ArcB [unclassified Agarivorans]|uniref:aerobic respiration two-component sensor histidine kinase ArcB n=1 Tax=unclassified Agarivorans TaxID=2636026 RepID=UPI0026E1D275|nr:MULTISPECIES: aerobic respiration two-component sensor histidine kinase ArcB [unclassified Agarivorans]MDO6685347.1 aerobic respiration two-component sensor histidine kinase ArcB [Agarivorans sp. 3_MG-2023]MDO6715481.1 aerobic respiration two-component sensor histidine kinase ArcB [Agarivorans sp. 2_MG-2023]